MKRLFYIAIVGGLLSGCVARTPLPASPRLEDFNFSYEKATYEDRDVAVSIHYANCGRAISGDDIIYGCEKYILRVTNKSYEKLFIDWDNTSFVNGGKEDGGLMFEGIIYSRREQPKPEAVVFEGGSFEGAIWPNSLVRYSIESLADGASWSHDYISNNPNGIDLVLRDEAGVEKRITLLAMATYMAHQPSQSPLPAGWGTHSASGAPAASATGKVVFGISFADVPPTLAATAGRAQLNGVIIAIIAPGSVAEKAGLKIGDVVMSYGNAAITKKDDLVAAVGVTNVGSKIPIHILRGKEEMDMMAVF